MILSLRAEGLEEYGSVLALKRLLGINSMPTETAQDQEDKEACPEEHL